VHLFPFDDPQPHARCGFEFTYILRWILQGTIPRTSVRNNREDSSGMLLRRTLAHILLTLALLVGQQVALAHAATHLAGSLPDERFPMVHPGIMAAAMAVALVLASAAQAHTNPELDEIRQQIKELKDTYESRIQALEKRLKDAEEAAAKAQTAATQAQSAAAQTQASAPSAPPEADSPRHAALHGGRNAGSKRSVLAVRRYDQPPAESQEARMTELSLTIVVPALLAGLLVAATHVPLGMQVLARGIVFIDLAGSALGRRGGLGTGRNRRDLLQPRARRAPSGLQGVNSV